MTKRTHVTSRFLSFIALGSLMYLPSWAAEQEAPLQDNPFEFLQKKQSKEGYVPFSFEKRNLVEIINELALKKGVNIILPQNAADLETLKNQTVTYRPQGRTEVPLDEAWLLLTTFLELSGFALGTKKDNLYAIERVGKPQEPGITRSVLPIYANVPPDKLPDSQEYIRYIYYLRNLRVPDEKDRDTNPISRILKDMLSPGAPVVFEPKTNGIIITDKANTIASVMQIIKQLDHSGYQETIQVIHLNNTPAQDVVKIFESLRAAAGGDGSIPSIRHDSRTESLSSFAEHTVLAADPRLNNIIIMGRQSAVERIVDFIQNYMDTAPESGKSVLHSYDLQYLDATQFAAVLNRIVAPLPPTGAQATSGQPSGPERYFQGVVIAAEEVKEVDIKTTTEEITLEARGGFLPTGLGSQRIFTGGNRLIIAALHDDWLRLKDLIESIDKPQPYVILEVLIADIRGARQKLVAGTVRNKTATNLPSHGFEFLSSNISDVNSVLGTAPQQLDEDLLRVLTGANSTNPSLTSLLAPGSLIISINDKATPGIFGLLQILDSALYSKILSHPYLITTNNQKATLTNQELRRRVGDAIPGAAGVITVEIIDLPATLQVQMIPRLSSLHRLSLQVAVDINNFIDANSDTRLTRRVNTNANLESGQVLVIGGLASTSQNDVITGTPILSQIPLIGSFFSNKSRTTTKNNISIFICPTIVHPKLRGGLDLYTSDKIRKSRRDMDDFAIFGDTKDPITRLFFKGTEPSDKMLTNYLSQVSNPPDAEFIKGSKERRREARRPSKRPARQTAKKTVPGPLTELPA